MAIYTGVADANGDFNIPFSSNYTSGQKITVTSEKDGATKNIELFAPSDVVNNNIQFTGAMANFPNDIGGVIIGEWMRGAVPSNFMTGFQGDTIWRYATSLEIKGDVTAIGSYAFRNWISCTKLILPSTISSMSTESFGAYVSCDEIIILATTPPAILATTFQQLKATCIFKVPASSVNAYKAAANWSTYASRIQAI